MKDTTFYSLIVQAVQQETEHAVTVFFEIPDELKDTFTYRAGQYLTMQFRFKGKEYRRSYSLCTSPGEVHPGVTVKRVKSGVVSNYILDHIRAGDRIDVMPPDGRFVMDINPEARKTYFMFAAGSGITPVMSHIKTLLEREPMSTIHLLYGNRNTDTIIFRDTLAALQEAYQGQLTVTHVLSRPARNRLFGALLGNKSPVWDGLTGRIDLALMQQFLREYDDRNEVTEYVICGPGDMIGIIKKELLRTYTTEQHIHTEYFTPSDSAKKENATTGRPVASLIAHLNGEDIHIQIEDKTILETLQNAGYDPPYSCTSGACATCMAKLIKGTVEMDMCFALNESEVAEGYILTCQSHPTSDEVEVTYDV